jgi:hypothetical protein
MSRIATLLLLLFAVGGVLAQNVISNGSFETPELGEREVEVPVGGSIGPWRVVGAAVRHARDAYDAALGRQSVELGAGGLEQTMTTRPFDPHLIRFALAGAPGGSSTVKTVRITWNGQVVATRSFDTTGRDASQMGWRYQEIPVETQMTTGVLRIEAVGGEPGSGPVIDDVSVLNGRGWLVFGPNRFNVTRGELTGGMLTELQNEDRRYVTFSQRAPFAPAIPNAEIELDAQALVDRDRCRELRFRLVSACTGAPRSHVLQRIQLFDHDAGVWVTVDERNPSNFDNEREVSIIGDVARFIEPFDRRVELRVQWFDLGVISPGWSVRVDLARWFQVIAR